MQKSKTTRDKRNDNAEMIDFTDPELYKTILSEYPEIKKSFMKTPVFRRLIENELYELIPYEIVPLGAIPVEFLTTAIYLHKRK